MQFKDFNSDKANDNGVILNERKSIPKDMVEAKLVLGEYFVHEKHKADRNISMAITVNNRTLFTEKIFNKSESNYFQLNLEDARTCVNDEIYNIFKRQTCPIDIQNITIFTLQNLYVHINLIENFEFGVIAKCRNRKPPGFRLSQ